MDAQSKPTPCLPLSWVNKIFMELQGHYGTRFLNMWKTGVPMPDGQDQGLVNAMDVWSRKLGGFKDHPEVFKRVLETLPANPPSLPDFVELCRKVPMEQPKALPQKFTKEDMERNKQRLKELINQFAAEKVTGEPRRYAGTVQ